MLRYNHTLLLNPTPYIDQTLDLNEKIDTGSNLITLLRIFKL